MGTLQVGGTTLATKNSSTGKVDLHESNISFPSGHIIQTQFTQVTTRSTQDLTADTDEAIDVLQVNITPHFNNSIIKLECYLMLEFTNVDDMNASVGFFFRNTTALGNTDSSVGNRKIGVGTGSIQYYASNSSTTPENFHLVFFDRPNDGTNTIAQITYKFGVQADTGGTIYINQTLNDSNNNTYAERGCSYISATEIAQSANGTITPAKAS